MVDFFTQKVILFYLNPIFEVKENSFLGILYYVFLSEFLNLSDYCKNEVLSKLAIGWHRHDKLIYYDIFNIKSLCKVINLF